MDDDGFTTVRRSARSRKPRPSGKAGGKAKPSAHISYSTHSVSESRPGELSLEQKLEKVLVILETRRCQLTGESGKGKEKSFQSSWTDQFEAVQSVLLGDLDKTGLSPTKSPRPVRIVCLGIGIVHESRESQFQFVLLDMLKEALGLPADEVWVYDPLFTPLEIRLLEKRGYKLIPKNERGKHKLDPNYQTLVYMPHCPGKLYDAFVRENWDAQILGGTAISASTSDDRSAQDSAADEHGHGEKVVLLANDFRGYIDNLPRRRVEEELPSLSHLTPHLSHIPFPKLSPSHIASNAFTSLVFQYVGKEDSGKIDWDVIPPEGVDREGVVQTEVIEDEIKDEALGKEDSTDATRAEARARTPSNGE